jgi:hypothetical protein
LSEFGISVSIEGLDLAAWESEFRSALAKAPADLGLAISAIGGAGALGAKRSGAVKVTGTGKDAMDTPIKALGLIIAALSLAVGLAQLNKEQKPVGPTFMCRIEGPQGVKELVINGAAIPSEHVLRECLRATGAPTTMRAFPPKKP